MNATHINQNNIDVLRVQTAEAAVQIIPSVALVGVHIAGLSLPEWAAITGIIFVSVQCARLLWIWSQELRGKR